MKRLAFLCLIFAAVGCDNGELETGYRPHKLDDSLADRRAYYASPYSPEAADSKGASLDPLAGAHAGGGR